MPKMYDSIKVRGAVRYRADKRFVGEDNVPPEVKEVLTLDNIVDENGLIIVDNKNADANKVSEEDQKELDNEKDSAKPEEEADKSTPTPPAPTTDSDSDEEDKQSNDDEDDDEPVKKAEPVKRDRRAKASHPRFASKTPQSHPGMGFPRVNGKTVDIFDGVTPHTHVKYVGGHMVPLSTESFNIKTEKQIQDKLEDLGFEIINFNRNEALDGTVPDTGDDEGDGLSDDNV